MTLHRFFLCVFTFFCVFSLFVFIPLAFGVADQKTALSKILEAEDALLSAYKAVLEAERVGGNISSLLVGLNEAGMLLSRAKLAYNTGDFDSATRFAEQSLLKLDGFVAEANDLEWRAAYASYQDFLVNFVGSGVGALGVFVVGVIIWNIFKRRGTAGGRV
jgi:hypothetical protein